MRKISVNDAVGQKLCHDITKVVPGEFKGVAFKRGHLIRPEDVEELLKIGKDHIFMWEEKAGEIHEDEAAVRIAEAVKGANIVYTPPQEGKTVLQATVKGLFKVNKPLLSLVNAIENITISALPDNFPVAKGAKLAGARIIPLVIQEEKIRELEKICSVGGPGLEVKPYKRLKVGVVITGNEVFHGRIEDKFGPVLVEKLKDYDHEMAGRIYCPDDLAQLQKTIDSLLKRKVDLIILTGGMSVDPDDLTPGAIRDSGAEVITYGAPIQPGNMFMMAYKGETALIGVPGAAIYHKTTVLDVVLPRIFVGDKLIREDFVNLGAGGFCLGCKECRYPLCYFGRS